MKTGLIVKGMLVKSKEVSKMADYKIADISLSDWGHKEISLAEIEMPGLMELRKRYASTKPLQGAK